MSKCTYCDFSSVSAASLVRHMRNEHTGKLKIYDELFALSENIRRLRQQRGWSQRELARRLHTGHPAVIRWEYPLPSMNLESLSKLADVFECSIQDLFKEPSEHVSYAGNIVVEAKL